MNQQQVRTVLPGAWALSKEQLAAVHQRMMSPPKKYKLTEEEKKEVELLLSPENQAILEEEYRSQLATRATEEEILTPGNQAPEEMSQQESSTEAP